MHYGSSLLLRASFAVLGFLPYKPKVDFMGLIPSIENRAVCSKRGFPFDTLAQLARTGRQMARTARRYKQVYLYRSFVLNILVYSLYWGLIAK